MHERLTENQRRAIIERDNHTSQMRHYTEQCGFKPGCIDCPLPEQQKLHVHHVDPHGNGGTNDAVNLLTIFECEHVGKKCDGSLVDPTEKFVVHPDMVEGLKRYRKGDKYAIAKVMSAREPLKEHGDVYWNPDHDAEMKETAVERTLNALNNGWVYPKRRRKNS